MRKVKENQIFAKVYFSNVILQNTNKQEQHYLSFRSFFAISTNQKICSSSNGITEHSYKTLSRDEDGKLYLTTLKAPTWSHQSVYFRVSQRAIISISTPSFKLEPFSVLFHPHCRAQASSGYSASDEIWVKFVKRKSTPFQHTTSTKE